ncbi:MAG: hypothetical protein KKC72_06235 [Alphaproteobacteria bacterium]|nr:hypothetical protein [Alphaproteobacteria bacterium]
METTLWIYGVPIPGDVVFRLGNPDGADTVFDFGGGQLPTLVHITDPTTLADPILHI